MSVTELALLRLNTSTNTTIPPEILAKFKKAKEAMEAFSSLPFSLYRCLEDPALIFLIGGWPNAKFHWEEWIPSKENQELLALLEGVAEVEYMFHVDVDRRVVNGAEGSGVVAVGRHIIKESERQKFQDTFGQVKGTLESFVGAKEKVVGGWRVEKGLVKGQDVVVDGLAGEKDEWVLFTAWESKERHLAFAETKEFGAYGKIKEWVGEADIKHGIKLDTCS